MVSQRRACRKKDGVSFRPPPWTVDGPEMLNLKAMISDDHLALRMGQAVASLDLRELKGSYVGTGSTPYDPQLMLRAVLYEMQQGRRSPAQWAVDARHDGPMRWLLQGYQPSRGRWYAFRDRLHEYVPRWHEQIVQQAVAQKQTPATRGALDGTLIAANASRHKMIRAERLAQRVDLLDRTVAVDQANAAPTAKLGTLPAADPVPGVEPTPQPALPPPAWLAPTPTGRLQQQTRYHQAQQRMDGLQERNRQKRASKRQDPKKIVVSVSDPEAALGRDKHDVYRPLYNLQLLADVDSPLLLAYDVFAQPNDTGTLGPMLGRTAKATGHRLEAVLADSAYAGGRDLAAAEAAGAALYAPWQENDYTAKNAKPVKQIPKKEFRWLADEQTYQCPQGHRLEPLGRRQQKRSGPDTVNVDQFRCPAEHCRTCPRRQQCTPNPEKGRTLSRGEHEDLIEKLKTRMQTPEAKALYRLRGQTVELPNADLKEHRGLRRFSGRGLPRAKTEAGLLVLAHNLIHVVKPQPPALATG